MWQRCINEGVYAHVLIMKILAFMQNMYFNDPEKVQAIFDRHPEDRNRLIGLYLFMGCKSGKVLRQTLGEDLCDKITWEESSRRLGDISSSRFPHDPNHIARAVHIHNPELILAFGAIASKGVQTLCTDGGTGKTHHGTPVLYGPHPAARNNPLPALSLLKLDIERLINEKAIDLGR